MPIPGAVLEKGVEEATKLLPQVYSDVAQPVAKVVGTTLGRTVSMLLAPVRGLLWGWEKIEQVVTEGVEKRLNGRPPENLKTPEPEVAVPLMQALTYTAQNDTLREMFLNLLANSMDSSLDSVVHPSYVEIIKQMDRLDALLFLRFVKTNNTIPVIRPMIEEKSKNLYYIDAVPEWFLGWTIENYSIFDISACMQRLQRLNIIEIRREKIINEDYSFLEQSPVLQEILYKYKALIPSDILELTTIPWFGAVNDFGKRFSKCCCQ
jgi:hypothetical protein